MYPRNRTLKPYSVPLIMILPTQASGTSNENKAIILNGKQQYAHGNLGMLHTLTHLKLK